MCKIATPELKRAAAAMKSAKKNRGRDVGLFLFPFENQITNLMGKLTGQYINYNS
jgi:hypothetical protein